MAGLMAFLEFVRSKKELYRILDEAQFVDAEAWAIVGMNVFLGLRYGVWAHDRPAGEVADVANTLLRQGIAPEQIS